MANTTKNNIIEFPSNQVEDKKNKVAKKTSKTKGHSLIIILCAFFVLVGVIFMFSDSSFEATNSVNGETISILSTSNYCFSDYKEGYIFAKDGKIACFNTDQKLQWEIPGSKTVPTVVTNDSYALTYYKKDNLAVVTNGNKTKKITTDGNVLYGSVNNNGYVTLLVNEEGFKSQIAVYDNKGRLKYKWHNSEKYITAAHLSDNNKTLIASEVKLLESGVESRALVANIKKETKFESIDLGDSTICDLKFISKNRFVVIQDDKTVCYTTKGKEKWKIDYSSENMYTYDVSDTNYFVFAFSADDSHLSNSYINIYNNSGKKVGSYASDKRISKVDIQNKTTLLTYDRNFEIISSNGKVVSESNLNFDIHNSIFMGNKKCALIFSGSGVSLIKPDKR